MIGNDLVDLGDPELAPERRHPRFDRRVFSRREREVLGASGAPDRLRWIFWAAKEAAYKVARKIDPRTVFSPSRFEVDVDATLKGCVHHGGDRFELRVDEAGGRIHALASEMTLHEADLLWRVAPFEGDAQTASKAVRALARRELAAALDLPVEELEIDRVDRIPVPATCHGELDVDLSLSHHGGFIAFACDLREGASAWRQNHGVEGP